MIRFLDLVSQYNSIKPEIDAAIADTIATSSFIGGDALKAFEAAFARFQSAEHCIGVGNGTDSLEIILEALDLPAGSEVIVPANSFISSSEAVTRSGRGGGQERGGDEQDRVDGPARSAHSGQESAGDGTHGVIHVLRFRF